MIYLAKLAGLALAGLVLAGCGGQERPVVILPPASLAECSTEPEAPVLGPPGVERDRAVLAYVLALREAWADCAAKVAGLASWRNAASQ